MDVISILKEDHREVEALFNRFEAASVRALKMKQKLFLQIKSALTVHAAAEEKILYPRMKDLRKLRPNAFEAYEEHRLVKQLLSELSAQEGDIEAWDAKVKVLIDIVRHHVKEEEGEIFKALKAELEKAELHQMGEALEAFKESFKAPPNASPQFDSEAFTQQLH